MYYTLVIDQEVHGSHHGMLLPRTPNTYSLVIGGGGGIRGITTPESSLGIGEGGIFNGILCPKRLAAPIPGTFLP